MAACCAAFLLASCSSAKAKDSQLLSPLAGKADNGLIDQVQSRNPGGLCSLVTKDGLARLMSFGRQGVVDVHGSPAILTYQPASHGNGGSFTGRGVRISGDLARQGVTQPGQTISRDVSVHVSIGDRTELLEASWTCQSALVTVRTRH